MPDLVKQTTKKSASTEAEERVRKARASTASWNKAMAGQAEHQAEAPAGPRTFLSGYGGASNMPEAKASPISAKRAEEDLPEAVRRIRHRLSPEGAMFLGALIRRSEEEGGKPINFTSDQTMAVTGLPRQKAQDLAEALIRDGLLWNRILKPKAEGGMGSMQASLCGKKPVPCRLPCCSGMTWTGPRFPCSPSA